LIECQRGQQSEQRRRQQRHNAAKKKTYKILDNGGTPFVVEITSTTVCVERHHTQGNKRSNKEIFETPYEHVFLGGKGRLKDAIYQKGSSILVCIKENHYVYIGSEIYSFKTTEPILFYESPIGSSETPYPYAVGDKYTYFMLDKEKVPNELLDLKKDAYGQFYGYTISKKEEAAIEKRKTPFACKTIYKQ
jgi:hypothetical protein